MKINEDKKQKRVELNIADAHFGEIVDISQTQINEYNPEIARFRIDKLFQEAIKYCDLVQVKDIDINILGDMLTGNIHEELIENSALPTVQTVIQMADYLSQWINLLYKKGI